MGRIYLAGPFFNDEQKALISKLEKRIEDDGFWEVYSPSRDGTGICPPDAAKTWREKTFGSNCVEIDKCDFLVCVLDYLLPEEESLRTIQLRKGEKGNPGSISLITLKSPPLVLPDTGTVWEMGYAWAKEKPMIGYAGNGGRLNLMLAQCLSGFCVNGDELDTALEMLRMPVEKSSEDGGQWLRAILGVINREYSYEGKII